MKEYKLLPANNPERTEQVINDMARAGWEVVSTSFWPAAFGCHLLITLARAQSTPNS
ncbi:MAG: hypothetical protein KH028_05325 [Oscillospiraceae bacterium]|jgi:hypothetical protein|nr:hypothetical protein [Oscillospiraceae bacterium]